MHLLLIGRAWVTPRTVAEKGLRNQTFSFLQNMQADYKNRADLIWKKSIYQYHAYYILPSQASLKSLITWTGTAQRVLTCISKDMCQVCRMMSVNINIPLCSLKPHHSSFIFVRKKTEPLFLMALFTAVSKSLNYCDFFFTSSLCLPPLTLSCLNLFFLSPMPIEHRDKATDVKQNSNKIM